MSLKLPDFSDPLITRLSVCMISREPEFVARIGDAVDLDARFGDDFWIHLAVDRESNEKGHFHIDVVRQFSEKKKPANSTSETVTLNIDSFTGLTTKAWLFAQFRIPKDYPLNDALPSLPATAEIGGDSLVATTLTLQFAGEPFDELRIFPNKNDGITVALDAFDEFTIDESCLVRAEAILRGGLSRFVLAQEATK